MDWWDQCALCSFDTLAWMETLFGKYPMSIECQRAFILVDTRCLCSEAT